VTAVANFSLLRQDSYGNVQVRWAWSRMSAWRCIRTYQWRVSSESVPSVQCARYVWTVLFKMHATMVLCRTPHGRHWYGTDTSQISANRPLKSYSGRHQIACFKVTDVLVYHSALSQWYGVANFTTLQDLSCFHSAGRTATLYNFSVTLKHAIFLELLN
jgi:tRNA U38,U39,U40 pseudouridine synthase TruA